MVNKTILLIFSSIFGYIASRSLTMMVLIPAFAGFKEDLNTEFVFVQTVLFVSFSLFYYLLRQGLRGKTKSKLYSLLGLMTPFYCTMFSLLEKVDNDHQYADFWFIFICSLVVAMFTVPLILSIVDIRIENTQKTEKKEAKETRTSTNQEQAPVVAFHANKTLTVRVHTMKNQLNEAKKLFSDIEVLHEIEKMERQLLDSQNIFMSVGELRKQEAEEMLEAILTTMETDMDNYLNQHNEEQLHGLEKILLQRQK